MAVNLFEATETTGIDRDVLTAPIGYDAKRLVDPKHGIEWEALVEILARLSALLDDDVERLRAVGVAMAGTPSYAFLRRIARSVLTLQSLYEAGERWLAPANVPHLLLWSAFPTPSLMIFRCTIPETYVASAPYLHIFEGLLTAVPQLLDLPPAVIERSRVTPRECEMTLRLPASRALGGRMRRATRALFHRRDALELLEEQRHEIAEGLEAAQRATQEIRALFHRLPDFVLVHRSGRILWTNRAMIVGLGYEHDDDLVGRKLLDIMAPVSRAFTERRMRGLEDHMSPDLIELKVLRRDGTVVNVEVAPTQTVSFGGQPARLVVARDITESMRLQQRLITADRLASIGMLAAGVAHEVNNPLAYVLNNIEMVIRELTPLGDAAAKSREKLAVALQGVDHIRVIVRDLLALSRTEEMSIGTVDVRAIVESTLSLAAEKIAERASLQTKYEDAPLVRGTPARLGQVLLNLLANALEALPMASRDANRLHVSVRRSADGGAVIEVTDNGVGIADEHHARVFDPFFTTKPFGSGTGLGLSISQNLLTEIGGALSFESTHGKGSTFRVLLAPAEGSVAPGRA